MRLRWGIQRIGILGLIVLIVACARIDAPTRLRLPLYPQSHSTYLFFDPVHGFQVEYFNQGRSFLWYPQRTSLLQGQYKTEERGSVKRICFRYAAVGASPAEADAFACENVILSTELIVERIFGDPFNLASGVQPFELKPCEPPRGFAFSLSGPDRDACLANYEANERERKRGLGKVSDVAGGS